MACCVSISQTIYVKLTEGSTVESAKAALEAAYEKERFVTVLPGAAVPHTRHVRGRYDSSIAEPALSDISISQQGRSPRVPPNNEAHVAIA